MKIKNLMLIVTLFLSPQTFAEIREIRSMTEVMTSVSQETVVVFDLDNTVLEPLQTLGSDQFFGYMKNMMVQGGMPEPLAVRWAIEEITPIQPHSQVKPVEASIPGLIRKLQNGKIPVFALTARPPSWAVGTLRQLATIGVDFSKSAPLSNIPASTPDEFRYLNGVIFLPLGQAKGPMLKQFLQKTQLKFQRLVFVDDKLSNVTSVDESLRDALFENINYRYGAADSTVEIFDPRVAAVEWACYKTERQIISDVHAKSILAGAATCSSGRY